MIKIKYRKDENDRLDPHHADIYMTRGDTLLSSLTLMLSNGAEYTPTEDDTVRFAVKKRYSDSTPLINVDVPLTETDDDTVMLLLRVEPAQTKSLRFGTYVYDLEITYDDGVVDTFLSGDLILTEEVH